MARVTESMRSRRHWALGDDHEETTGQWTGSGRIAAPPATGEPGTGTQIGEYVLGERIGRGGMGVIYAAEHPIIGKPVAVKLLNRGLADDEHVVQRFLDEARAVNRIRSPTQNPLLRML